MRTQLIQVVNDLEEKYDLSPETVTIEVTGDESKINALIELLRFWNKEVVRTGIVALDRELSSSSTTKVKN